MAVETLVGGHFILLFLAAGQREREEKNWTIRESMKDGKCPVIVQAISSRSRQEESKQFPPSFKNYLTRISVVLKKSLPQLIWDEAEAEGCRE